MYCSACGKPLDGASTYCQHCGATVPTARRRLARYSADKKIAGVCGGVARYLDLDATAVRAVWLLCVLAGGFGVLAYLLLWIVMPLDPPALLAE